MSIMTAQGFQFPSNGKVDSKSDEVIERYFIDGEVSIPFKRESGFQEPPF